jgi:hypothetical protein
LGLSACGGNGSPVTPGSAVAAPDVVAFSGAARKGISAHYVVETGTNADGRLQLSVRFLQARSMLDDAKPLTDARVRYPDGSIQFVDSTGMFDAGASAFAAKHGQNIRDLKGIVVRILSPSATAAALNPRRFALYVPSAKEEARETSSYRERKIGATLRGGGLPCEPSYKQKLLDPDAVVQFGILLNSRQQVVSQAAYSCDRGDPDTEARIVGFEFISVSDLIRWNYYYQAPSREELKGAGITQAREYLEFRVPTLYPVYSPRYVTNCGAQGC